MLVYSLPFGDFQHLYFWLTFVQPGKQIEDLFDQPSTNIAFEDEQYL